MKKILVVDDSQFIRESLKVFLQGEDFQVVGEAENGIVAIAKYKELKPDIVTMDITMPEMEGIEALTKIMEIDPEAIVVMLSALGQESKVKASIMAGARNFIVKPFKEEHLLKVLKSL